MNVIHMKDDYSILCEEIIEIGPFEAYKRYTMKYPKLFENILKGLYMTDLDNLKPMIELIDFKKSLEIAHNNYRNGMAEKVVNIAKDVTEGLNFNEDFDIYLGLELGNINGCSCPSSLDKPFVYIGFDIKIDETSMKHLIPHEINHMIRLNAIKNIDNFDFLERTISEGLGAYCPIIINNMDFSVDTISIVLNIPSNEVIRLNNNVEFLIEKVTREFGSKLTYEKMNEYFTWSDSDSDKKYLLSGYYVGMIIIKKLLENGYNLSELTVMPATVIWEKYNNCL